MQLAPLSEFDYHATLARTAGASLVVFGSGACRKVENLLPGAAGSSIAALFKVDVQQATALARQYALFHLPALFLYHDGLFHAELQCEVTPSALRQAINNALAKPAQEEP
jgi:thioredoxin 1